MAGGLTCAANGPGLEVAANGGGFPAKQRAGRATDGGGDSPRTANKDEPRAA